MEFFGVADMPATKAKGKKLDHESEAARLQRNCIKMKHRGIRVRVNRIMHSRPEMLSDLKDWLVQMGWWDAAEDELADQDERGASEPVECAASKKHKVTDAKELSIASFATSEASPVDGSLCLHRNFNRVENVPIVHLRRWLTRMEPVAYSDAKLAQLCKHGKRDANRRVLAELVEFPTGITSNQALFAKHGDGNSLAELESRLVIMNQQNGRVARDLVMPPDWDSQGYYFVQGDSQGVSLWNRYRGVNVRLPLNFAPLGTAARDFVISNNCSERRATIMLQGSTVWDATVCLNMFMVAGIKVLPDCAETLKQCQPIADANIKALPPCAFAAVVSPSRMLVLQNYNSDIDLDIEECAAPATPSRIVSRSFTQGMASCSHSYLSAPPELAVSELGFVPEIDIGEL